MTYPVQLYGLAPDHSVKGIIRGAPLRFSERELLDNMYVPNHEIYACRRLGNSNIVVVTFAGNKVPYYVNLFGSEYPCSLYKKTVPVCDACHELGHTATACPQPNTRVCHQCGVKDPKPGHDCKALCSLCGGPTLRLPRAARNASGSLSSFVNGSLSGRGRRSAPLGWTN
ncbi:hypothetical protein HPB48_017802 [Haemaphysalis longicornis]|uniref:CCHC-type domain-containing protein n=1 Tax=Haemaphysalis longicornis TaxID=44386 RepID=A0A9J6FJV9_HAELO|nr:hypothetical protein HPB48_017802 [Haemaphysalis longicornis]